MNLSIWDLAALQVQPNTFQLPIWVLGNIACNDLMALKNYQIQSLEDQVTNSTLLMTLSDVPKLENDRNPQAQLKISQIFRVLMIAPDGTTRCA